MEYSFSNKANTSDCIVSLHFEMEITKQTACIAQILDEQFRHLTPQARKAQEMNSEKIKLF